jgi:prepilin-type N-terminal cleavage/methylation domain-containing protein
MMYPHKIESGFTLVELLVTISIFVVMTSILLIKYGNFSQGTLLTNLAYDVALTIRTAQTYGVSVQGQTSGGIPDFTYAYGVHFDKSTGSNQQIILFVDLDKNGVYDTGETVSVYNIKRGAKIAGFCVSITGICSAIDSNINYVDISFLRPNPDAGICYNEINCNQQYLKIFVQSGDDNSVRSVTIRRTGQISIDD